VLREISSQTAESSAATSNSVGKLAELSAGLRKSVSGFRLPDAGAGKAELLADLGRKPAPPTVAPAASPTASAPRPVPKKVSGLAS
jgi:twitching motility protein PilJ